jgi:hypothetical protein
VFATFSFADRQERKKKKKKRKKRDTPPQKDDPSIHVHTGDVTCEAKRVTVLFALPHVLYFQSCRPREFDVLN